MRNRISIVVTFRNEEEVIPSLVGRISAAFQDTADDYELIFVNDDSTDRSADIVTDLHSKDQRIKAVTTSRRFGVYACMLAGLRLASGDCAIYLDCDLQDPPELIPKMLAAWRSGADIVHMRRTRRLGDSWLHVRAAKFGYCLIHLASPIEIPVDVGDFKLYSRRALDQLSAVREVYPYIRGLAAWIGFNQIVLDYERMPREAGTSKRAGLSRAAIRVFVNAIVSFSGVPIYLLGLLGGIGATVSVLWIILALLLGADAAHIGLAVSVLALSVTLLSNFTLGFYVYRIWQEVLRRPSFIIKDRLGL